MNKNETISEKRFKRLAFVKSQMHDAGNNLHPTVIANRIYDVQYQIISSINSFTLDEGGKSNVKSLNQYAIPALATCLEWHARSRINDLFTLDTKYINNTDYEKSKQNGSYNLAFADGVTVIQYLVSSININDFRDYKSYIDRILSAIGSKIDIDRDIRAKYPYSNLDINKIDIMFHKRHQIIHEITEFSSYPIARTSLEEYREYAEIVRFIFEKIESEITNLAPPDLQNRLNEAPGRTGKIDRNMKLISDLEDWIGSNIEPYIGTVTKEIWEDSCAKFWEFAMCEGTAGSSVKLNYIINPIGLSIWYIIIEDRLKYLRIMKNNIEETLSNGGGILK